RRPAALPRARAHDGDRRGTARARSGRGRAAQPRPRRPVPVPDSQRRTLRLRRLRGLPRRGAPTLGLRGAPRRASGRAAGRLLGIGVACVVEPSISNRGYVTLALTPEERGRSLPKSGNAEGASVMVS